MSLQWRYHCCASKTFETLPLWLAKAQKYITPDSKITSNLYLKSTCWEHFICFRPELHFVTTPRFVALFEFLEKPLNLCRSLEKSNCLWIICKKSFKVSKSWHWRLYNLLIIRISKPWILIALLPGRYWVLKTDRKKGRDTKFVEVRLITTMVTMLITPERWPDFLVKIQAKSRAAM